MLASLGATDRHVRLALLANGATVGTVAAVAGTAADLAGWLAFAPTLEEVAAHRIDRFDIPWWAIGVGMALAVLTAVAAAWWPARAAQRAGSEALCERRWRRACCVTTEVSAREARHD